MARRVYETEERKSGKTARKRARTGRNAVSGIGRRETEGKRHSPSLADLLFRLDKGRSAADEPEQADTSDVLAVDDYSGIHALMNPLWCYYGFRIAVIALTCFGVVMVFSASSVTMIARGASPWKQAMMQGAYCLFGFAVCALAMRPHASSYRKCSFAFVVFSIFLQLLTVTPLGVEVNGNKGWIGIPNKFTMQPAEVMKLALCVWMPWAVASAVKHHRFEGVKAYLPMIFIFLACLGAVMLGGDLGTAMILVIIGVTAMLVGGFPTKWLIGAGLVLVVLVVLFVVTSPNRMLRITSAYRPCPASALQGECYQSVHAKYAMASGGFFGVGIGNSREKWNYLPEAHNDFIFAIIGEETGFVGAAAVVILFAILGWCMFVIALQTPDKYASRVLICIAIWIVGQALVNIMVVIGLLPVMGVPLPFVSAGGSSLVMCLFAAGVATSMMRMQPQIQAGIAASRV
ncbi:MULTISPECIES: putative peptidoglycan glycosyltransferase FtsW [unclassified Bifidobacterium]|uniref:peptidoglycan glycosyltransferase FtsW n=1 Tax=unclassified Bifidobacterium TaxID=2608897 RepID=UPI0023F987C9|nr:MULTISPECIES: putative peptidoglycan glycosyltransferase FtsW [unclassified Bifidobacterium]WEV66252.1 putative peptidoglycan glycosyltransferase FtsW [Bifidobacterium sp. ESL0764]WEV74962.1 putative peptidoglycan glycosyltransferase FtsW [Bifidobacterium sp. ESL0800]